MIEASQCRSMTEVRAAVDAIDREIVTLLGRRLRFIEAAARIKSCREEVRDEVRKNAVIGQARANAVGADFPPDLVAQLYEILVEASIAYELECFDSASAD